MKFKFLNLIQHAYLQITKHLVYQEQKKGNMYDRETP